MTQYRWLYHRVKKIIKKKKKKNPQTPIYTYLNQEIYDIHP